MGDRNEENSQMTVKELLDKHEDGQWDDIAKRLTPQQRRFVEIFVFDSKCAGDWATSCKKAGYTNNHASQLKRKPHVMEAIKFRKSFLYKNKTISQVEAVADLRELYLTAKQKGNFVAMTAAVKMKLEVSGLVGDKATTKPQITNNTQINLTPEAHKAITKNLTAITSEIVKS